MSEQPTAELRAALRAALLDMARGEPAAATLIMEMVSELVLQYEFAVDGLRQARKLNATADEAAAIYRAALERAGRDLRDCGCQDGYERVLNVLEPPDVSE